MRAIDAYNEIQEISKQVKMPWAVNRAFKDFELEIMGDQISFGEDFLTLEEARETLELLTETLGGKVKWEKIK